MPVKVKEIKDSALIDIKVNKNFYLMSKDALYTIFKHLIDGKSKEESVQHILTKQYQELGDFERAFYTITLLLSEIEKQVQENPNLYDEKEVPEPGDPDYVEPKQG
jgi:hypothetical protein